METGCLFTHPLLLALISNTSLKLICFLSCVDSRGRVLLGGNVLNQRAKYADMLADDRLRPCVGRLVVEASTEWVRWSLLMENICFPLFRNYTDE